jgi:EAL domain-containing protein (putative c-di-GMP-specific phosphodiesterase class I)/CheY-like chemotaxis protein/HPt (histidine-containing phosphotransfer) domain-containing protein
MGGALKLLSRDGRGVVVAFDLPAHALEASAPWPKAGPGATCAVLVTGASTRSALGRYLAAADLTVTALDDDSAVLAIAGPVALKGRERLTSATMCLREIGDGAPGEVMAAGLADVALTQPLRRAELEAVLRRAFAGEPLALALADEGLAAAEVLPSFAGRRILVADDSALGREIATEALAALGVAPAIARDGAEAIGFALAGEPFDAILVNASMSGLDGYEVAREIRRCEAEEGRARTPIIALAAPVAGPAEAAWSDADMDALVHKPFTRASLAAALSQFIEPAPTAQIAPAAPTPPTAAQIAAAGIPTSELLDPQVGVELARLAAAGKADFVDRVRRLYRENAPVAVKAVIDAAVARDPEATVRSAHALKSMSLNMGARLVAETAARIESQARDMGVVNVDQTQVLHRQLLATLDVLDGYPPTVGQTTAAPAADAEERSLLSDLGEAIGKDELSLVYQPQFDRDGETITGVETLLRWNHPVRGFVSPALFIPLAERHGLIGPITQWVLDRAMSETEDLGLTISFNASAVEFADPCFVDELSVMIARRRFDPRRLEIEVTETAVLAEEDEVRRNMARLHEIGLKIALDDFGVGYSSLSHLRLFPFDKLKIDRAFVTGCAENVQSATLVHAVVAIGRSLGMQVVAEGVETEAQRAFLKAAGVHAMQGYFFAKPEPIAALRERLGLKPLAAQSA